MKCPFFNRLDSLAVVPLLFGVACTTSPRRSIPEAWNNRVAYYAFDATPVGQEKLSLTDFSDKANIIVLFEGNIFELADPEHYGKDDAYILSISDGPYTRYEQIIADIHTLQARGILVLMNVDDTQSWQTEIPFTDYAGEEKTYEEYAALVYEMAQNVPFDGIALDVEHFSGPANQNFINLVREFGNISAPNRSIQTAPFTPLPFIPARQLATQSEKTPKPPLILILWRIWATSRTTRPASTNMPMSSEPEK